MNMGFIFVALFPVVVRKVIVPEPIMYLSSGHVLDGAIGIRGLGLWIILVIV
jgi:hypothetical protein